MKKLIYLVGIALVVTLLVSGGSTGLLTAIEDVAAQNVACYGEQGGAKHVAASGCEYEFRSGSTLDIQNGTTLGMAGALSLTQVNAAGGSANPFDYTGTLGIMNNDDTFELFDINMTNANHTGANNVVTVMDIANITGDPQAAETAFKIGSGFDQDLNFVTSGEVSVDDTNLLTFKDPPAADGNTTTDGVQIAYSTPIDTQDTNVHNAVDVAMTIGNASGGTNSANAVNISNITGDAQVTESAVKFGTGFDSDLNFTTSGEVAVDSVGVAVLKDPAAPDSNATNEIFEIVGTTPVDTQDTNVHNFLTIDAAIGNASGGTNSARGIQIDSIAADAQVTETGINIDTGWDNALDVNGQNVVLGADGGVVLDESADDVLGLTFGAGTGTFSILTGNGLVGNGAPSVAQDGEDFYVEGHLEVDTGATLGGTIALDAGEIGATEIADVTRSVNIPLMSFIECTTNGGATIEYTDGADAFPDFINNATDGQGFVLAFDDTGGQLDTAYVCSQLMVPPDYASGGAFAVRTTKDAETGANAEVINCAGSINGAALEAGGTVTVATNVSTRYSCTPTLTALAAGDSLSFELHVTVTVDDIVNIHAVEFVYTATQ